MNALNTAIYSTLTGDATLVALLADATSVYHLQAKDGAPFDFVVYNKMSAIEPNTEAHRIINAVYQIRAYSDQSAQAADAIDARIDALLHNQAVSITGYTRLRLVRTDSIEMTENLPNGLTVWSSGGLYQIRLEKN